MSAYITHVSGQTVNTTVVQTLDTNVTTVRYSAPYNVTRVTEGLPGTPGSVVGGMADLVYDPTGVRGDVFDAANLRGVIDAGTFN